MWCFSVSKPKVEMMTWKKLAAASTVGGVAFMTTTMIIPAQSDSSSKKPAAEGESSSSQHPDRMSRWKSKWAPGPGQASWHLGSVVHPRLAQYQEKLLLDSSNTGPKQQQGEKATSSTSHCRRVLVPLAGKSHDVAFLARLGHDVVAVGGVMGGWRVSGRSWVGGLVGE